MTPRTAVCLRFLWSGKCEKKQIPLFKHTQEHPDSNKTIPRFLCSPRPFREKPNASWACMKLLLKDLGGYIHNRLDGMLNIQKMFFFLCYFNMKNGPSKSKRLNMVNHSASFTARKVILHFKSSLFIQTGRVMCVTYVFLPLARLWSAGAGGRCLQETIPLTVVKYYRFISTPLFLCVHCLTVRLCEWRRGSVWQEQEVVAWCDKKTSYKNIIHK